MSAHLHVPIDLLASTIKLVAPDDYEPKEQWSPSGLSYDCDHAWALRYIQGLREADLPEWPDVAHLERPAEVPKGAPAIDIAARQIRLKNFNRLTRRALGHAIHDVLARHYDWHPPHELIDWNDFPGRVALAGLGYLPAVEACGTIEVEVELAMAWGPADDPVKVWGFADLIVTAWPEALGLPNNADGTAEWFLVDYKSTYTFDYVPLVEELLDDVAACFYALAVMVREGLDHLRCRWVYFRTDDQLPEDSRKVDFTITREHAIKVLAPYEAKALRLRRAMRESQALRRWYVGRPLFTKHEALKQRPTTCGDFGGCVYHHERGGPCRPPKPTTGQLAKKQLETRETLRKRREAQRANRGVQREGARPKRDRTSELPRERGAEARASLPLSAHHVTETTRRTTNMGRFADARKGAAAGGAAADAGAAAGGAAEGAADAGTATGAGKPPKAPKAPRAAAAPPALGLTLQVEGGPSIPLPAGSKLHDLASKLVDVLYPAE